MKILVVDNNTVHKNALATSLLGDEIEVQVYKPGIDFSWQDKDLIILSGGGGAGREIRDYYHGNTLWYQDQIDFVRTIDKPILGICMGFEVICHAFGGTVDEMDRVIEGLRPIKTTKTGAKLLKAPKFEQHKAHKWHVKEVPAGLDALAESSSGIELVMHQSKPIIASQFHPEVQHGTFGISEFGEILLNQKK